MDELGARHIITHMRFSDSMVVNEASVWPEYVESKAPSFTASSSVRIGLRNAARNAKLQKEQRCANIINAVEEQK